jgi:hypothetical protein
MGLWASGDGGHALSERGRRGSGNQWLSGQYFEFYDGSDVEKLCACCHFIPLEMKKQDALCKMNIGSLKAEGLKRSKSLRVFHQPEKDSPGYAGLHGIPRASDPVDDELLSLLATLAALDTAEISKILQRLDAGSPATPAISPTGVTPVARISARVIFCGHARQTAWCDHIANGPKKHCAGSCAGGNRL